MKKILLYIGIGIAVIFLLLFGTEKWMNARTYQLFGGIVDRVETSQKVVALTFDDGPTENVNRILPLLDKYNAKATFFLIGGDIEKYPEGINKIAEAGHQIGNHTYSHKRMVFKSSSYIKEEIEKTDRLIRDSGYKGVIDFRPPYGKKLVGLPYYLNKHDRETITWNIEPDTFYSKAADKVNYVKERIKPGSIILMHPMYDKTGEELLAIEGILQALSNEGYRFVSVDELQEL
ncbi:polysaccharide deacetylase family protein [Paenibacillus contaminans]|uniref:Polysaccharide deacetylase n=1 Tax=Paenibacillus contaminans TaxID=450362 RepID=A0A329LRY1_9BACL|nr:polysaccharide deacetylase family protein [Paenibacillus contaminans]RAV09916.1 polysaccharide deacetylase [Paenibacillus contaminans]